MSELNKLVIKAYHIAEEAHRGQNRKWCNDPYIVHPVRVSYRAVANIRCTGIRYVDAQVVALLHDTIEDTDTTVESLKEDGMGGWADVVDVLTHKDGVTYFDYIRSIRKYAEDNDGDRWRDNTAILVKVADIMDNMTDMPPHDPTNQLHVHTKEHSLHKRYRKAFKILRGEL